MESSLWFFTKHLFAGLPCNAELVAAENLGLFFLRGLTTVRPMRLLSIFALSFSLTFSLSHGAHWPAWRGAGGGGVVEDAGVPLTWSEKENVVWKVELPDRGNSTPVIWGDSVFLTQAVEATKTRSTLCFHRSDGRLLWKQEIVYEKSEDTHPTNPHCSASPVTDGERVIVCHGSAGVFCYDVAGKELWRRDLGPQDYEWGSGSSPVLHGDLCILYFGPGDKSEMVALDKRTGADVWRWKEPALTPTERTDGFRGNLPGMICTYSTPLLVRAGTRDELIMTFPGVMRSFDPATGKELWLCDGLNPLVYTSPIAGEGVAIGMGGFFGTSIAVRLDGSAQGDVTATHRLWQTVRTKNRLGSGVIAGGHAYILNTDGFAECLEIQTGKQEYLERLTGIGPKGDSWSSMVLAGDRIYVFNQSGDGLVLKAAPKFEVLARNSIGNELTNSSPAISNGQIFLRTHKHLWCIGASQKP